MARRVTTISIALVLALLGTLLVVVYVGRADARAAEGIETVKVLVAKGPLVKGQTVSAAKAKDLIGEQLLPRKTVPAGALSEFAATDVELVFASDVTQGEMILRPRLVNAAAVAVDGLVVPEGKVAVSILLADPSGVGTFVKVGSEVAVFDSYNALEGNDGTSRTPSGDHLADEFPKNKATRLLLPRVKVLAIGAATSAGKVGATDEPDADAQPAPAGAGKLYTLAADQRQAEKLIHGMQTGTLSLALLGTYELKPSAGVDNRTLFND